MKTAHPISGTPQGYAGWRRAYRLSEPYRHTDLFDEVFDYEYVVVSSGREHVQVFPGNEHGYVLHWGDMATHPLGTEPEAVLAAMGYEVRP